MSRYRPFLYLGGGIIAATLFGLTGFCLVTLVEVSTNGRLLDNAVWGESAKQERKDMESELEMYKKLWKKNRSQIMQKINDEYKEFKSQKNK